MRFVAAVAQLHREEGLRINVTSSHPDPDTSIASTRHFGKRSQLRSVARVDGEENASFEGYRSSQGRAVISFEFVGMN